MLKWQHFWTGLGAALIGSAGVGASVVGATKNPYLIAVGAVFGGAVGVALYLY